MSDKSVTMYTDGGSRGNPGPSACAAWFPSLGLGVSAFSPMATNNVAEYEALVLGLTEALRRGITHLRVKSDSTLMVNQVNGRWAVKNPALSALCDEVRSLAARLEHFSIEYVPREQNAEADRLCNEEMDAAENDDPMRFIA